MILVVGIFILLNSCAFLFEANIPYSHDALVNFIVQTKFSQIDSIKTFPNGFTYIYGINLDSTKLIWKVK